MPSGWTEGWIWTGRKGLGRRWRWTGIGVWVGHRGSTGDVDRGALWTCVGGWAWTGGGPVE